MTPNADTADWICHINGCDRETVYNTKGHVVLDGKVRIDIRIAVCRIHIDYADALFKDCEGGVMRVRQISRLAEGSDPYPPNSMLITRTGQPLVDVLREAADAVVKLEGEIAT